jgi:hypothetical protein
LSREHISEETIKSADYNKLLKDLADDQWREFNHKTRHEWKLSFSIWGGLLASITALLSGKITFTEKISLHVFLFLGVSIVIFILALHFWFLWWIQNRLQIIRKDAWDIYAKRWNQLFPEKQYSESNRSQFDQPSLWVQLGITLLLSTTLLLVAKTIIA